MRAMANGIAHVSFSGGGIFLPVRNPYDRQMLAEHVTDRVRVKGQVQVLLDEQRWMVQLQRGANRTTCSQCGAAADSACYASGYGNSGPVALCVQCAFAGETAPEPQAYSLQQAAS